MRTRTISDMFNRLRNLVREYSIEIVIAIFLFVFLAIFTIPVLLYAVPAGHVGVLWKRFGGGTDMDNPPMAEGSHLVWPWNVVTLYDMRLRHVNKEFDVLSSDGLKMTINVSWQFHIDQSFVSEIHKNLGPEFDETVVVPQIGSRARDIISRNSPEDLYQTRRSEIEKEIKREVELSLPQALPPTHGTKQQWLLFTDLLIRDIKLPPAVEEAIVRKNEQYHLNQEYNFRLLREAKEAQRKRIEALGIKDFQNIISTGITDSYLRWKGIEATLQLAQSNNAKMVIIGSPKEGMPLILGGLETTPAKPGDKTSGVPAKAELSQQPVKPGSNLPPTSAVKPAVEPPQLTASGDPKVR